LNDPDRGQELKSIKLRLIRKWSPLFYINQVLSFPSQLIRKTSELMFDKVTFE